MELRHLRYFVAVAEELNFSRAAERLHMAQPPLSTQIRALEGELGAQLFERDRRHVALTQPGRLFLEQARAILASAEAAQAQARSAAAGIVGVLTLGYVASAMLDGLLPATVRSFQAAHPEVALHIVEMSSLDQLDALHRRAIDLGIVRKPEALVPAGVTIKPWYEAPLVVAMASDHRLAKRAAVKLAELSDDGFVMYPRDAGIGIYWRVIDLCAKAGFRPRIVREVRESSSIVGLVAAGAGVAVVPQATSCIGLSGVIYQRLADANAVSALHLASRRGDRDPHQANLTRMLEGAAAGRNRMQRAGQLPARATAAPFRSRSRMA